MNRSINIFFVLGCFRLEEDLSTQYISCATDCKSFFFGLALPYLLRHTIAERRVTKKMGTLQWIQFSLGVFATILQQIQALRGGGIKPSVSTPLLIAQAHTAPGLTDEHKTVISAAGAAAQAVAEAKDSVLTS